MGSIGVHEELQDEYESKWIIIVQQIYIIILVDNELKADNDVWINFISDDATARNTPTYTDSKNSWVKMDNGSPVICISTYYYHYCNTDDTVTLHRR